VDVHYLHRLSGLCFYVLGLSGFIAYLFVRNNMWPGWSAAWLQIADLPFALSALTYGGLSFYKSLAGDQSKPILGWIVAVVLGVIFGVLVIANFWGVISK
jgi:hypothetical protein